MWVCPYYIATHDLKSYALEETEAVFLTIVNVFFSNAAAAGDGIIFNSNNNKGNFPTQKSLIFQKALSFTHFAH